MVPALEVCAIPSPRIRRMADPIVIIGMSRSGTTFVGRLLESRPGVHLETEPHMVWKAGSFSMRDRTVRAGVQKSSFLRFEEFGADRVGRLVPPEPPEDVGRAARLVEPASRGDVRPYAGEVESVLPFVRDGFVPLEADRTGVARAVPGESEPGLPGYTVVDFTVSRSLVRNLDVFLGVQNVFDREYIVGTLPTTIGSPAQYPRRSGRAISASGAWTEARSSWKLFGCRQ